MVEKRFAKNVLIISVASAVLALFTYIFVAHHRDTPDRVRRELSTLLSTGSSVAERTKPIGQINIASTETPGALVSVAAAVPVKVDGQQVYQSACVACHGAGIAGAPKVGNASQWAERIAKGLDTLYVSAINGVQGSAGVMPAKGGNLALSDAEVKAAVDYIVAQLQ